jgi:hypothetical protein
LTIGKILARNILQIPPAALAAIDERGVLLADDDPLLNL